MYGLLGPEGSAVAYLPGFGAPRRDADAEQKRLADSRAAAREAALAEAQATEEEAAAASNDCDAAAERVRAALARVAKARADAAAAADPIDPVAAAADPIDPAPGDGLDISHAMALHEAAAILNLHTQAVSFQNARSLVQVTLDTSSGNYSRWREQFLLAVTKYSLQDHIYSDHATSALPDWTQMNAVVKSWLYSTISSNLAEAVIEHRATAHEAWLAIEGHFLGNQETRALHLDAKFRRFKKMADDLADLGEHVTDRTLVLNVIRGLNERYKDIGVHLRRGRPFPSFAAVRNELLLEEINMVQHPVAPSTALVATGSSAPCQPAPTDGGAPQTGAPKQNKKKKQKDRRTRSGGTSAPGGGGSSGGPSSTPGASAGSGGTWPSSYNPWTGSIQMWPGPRTPPLAQLPQGRTGPQQQQALLALQGGQQLPQAAQQLPHQQAFLPAYGAPVQPMFKPQQPAPSAWPSQAPY
ncbi:uncharacterized protein LOC120668056 [Panicum virgatum]|uniref:uncharacterized protein LOC120668056 n=1 Tax=Panicum virgatum TaxID=38727 RepID=UPI0019D64A4A|nr:uncharacterized protein LOC120668056 [Panicum virgatum]